MEICEFPHLPAGKRREIWGTARSECSPVFSEAVSRCAKCAPNPGCPSPMFWQKTANRFTAKRVSVRSSPLAGLRSWREDQRMVASELSSGHRVRRWRSVSEKRQIVQLTLEPGASVAEVARAHGVNANQVFKWRREFERGELADTCAALIPVTVTGSSKSTNDAEQAPPVSCQGAIHIELEGRAVISVESGADPSLVRLILESLRK